MNHQRAGPKEKIKRGQIKLTEAEHSKKPVRFFIAKNSDLKKHFKKPRQWKHHGFMSMKVVELYEDRWKALLR
jgi:hypothetical protein